MLGASSQITVTRAGHYGEAGEYVPGPNGGVLHAHFTDPQYREQAKTENVQGQRVTISLLGDGYIEAIDDRAIIEIAERQRKLTGGRIVGKVSYAPILEAPDEIAVGRFGWKGQHASLASSAADALRTELGIYNRLYPSAKGETKVQNLKDCWSTIEQLTAFIRDTEYPRRDETLAASPSGQDGSRIFDRIGCVCVI